MVLKTANKCSEVVDIEGIGTITIQENPIAKYVRIKLHPEKGTILIIPGGMRKETAFQFLLTKKDWIRKKQNLINHRLDKRTVFSHDTVFSTYAHQLHIQKHSKQTLKCRVADNSIRVWYPENADVMNERVQNFIRKTIIETWKMEAKQFVPKWVKEQADKFGFSYNTVRIKDTKTRWGSCSAKKNLNFSLHIMRLPEDLRNYLILHELTHTVVPNHGREFWQRLRHCLPYAKVLDKKLNSYHIEIW